MGWSHGYNKDGREVGYSVEATCDHPDCDTVIDRGISYLCGGVKQLHNEEYGCGKFFCDKHTSIRGLCFPCMEKHPICINCGEYGYIEEGICDNCEFNPEEDMLDE